MTRFRYTLVLAAAVLFTLALGIALGGGPLQTQVTGALESVESTAADPDGGGPDSAALARRNRELSRALRYDDAFADAVAPGLLAGSLADRRVVVLALPGVAPTTARAVADDVTAAGGSVTSSLRVGRDLVDPTARALVDELTSRLVPGLGDVEVPEGTPVYTRVGVVMSRALLTTEDAGVAVDDTARSVFNSFATAGLLNGPEPQQRASLAVVLVPETGRRTATTAARGTILTETSAAMDQAGDGLVVAGPPSSADRGGLVAAVRAAPTAGTEVSTVDTVTQRAGQMVTVLALGEQAGGTTRHYGVAESADAVLPGQAGAVSQ